MALRMRKDIKKSSYYVWFLGAQESKGLRGAEYIHPVVKSLVQRERDVEPFKVTLQVSHKGLKIIQNIPPTAVVPGGKPNKNNSKPELIKHFIPHHAVTCVLQDEDIVSCILLLYNPVTKCPVHVHAYRCDSVETAEILRGQLQTLIERPENQKKLGEIETRLRAKGLLLPPPTQSSRPGPNSSARRINSGGGGSDGRSTSTRESESSGGSSSERLSGVGGHQERIANLYDSLAAELREKLGTGGVGKGRPQAPILLPPRDYDTVHRQKGNLTAIDLRRCLNANIVGVNAKNSRNLKENGGGSSGKNGGTTSVPGQPGRVGSSGGSSGIGSDHAPSPDGQDRESDPRYLDNQSSSDEDWNEQPSEDSLFLVQPTTGGRSCSSSSWRGPGADLSLPRARRVHSSGIESPSSPSSPVGNVSGTPPDLQAFRRRRAEERQRSPSPSPSANKKISSGPLSPRDRFKDAKEKFLLLERERLEEQERQIRNRRTQQNSEPPIAPAVLPTAASRGNSYQRRGSWSRSRDSEEEVEERPPQQRSGYFGGVTGRDDFGTPEPEVPPEDDDIFEQGYNSSPIRRVARRDTYQNHIEQEEVIPVRRGHRSVKPELQVYRGGRTRGNEDPRIIPQQRYRSPPREERQPHRYPSPSRGGRGPQDEEIVPERRPVTHRFSRSPTRAPRREQDYSPDRRERFMSPTRNPRPQPRNQRKIEEDIGYPEEISRYRGGPRDRTPNTSRGHMVLTQQTSFSEDSNSDIPLERYRSPMRNPQPAPRHRIPENEVITSPEPQRRNIEGRLPRANPFQIPSNAGDKKRRSMFEVLEEERRRNSNELAKEFKRRSYQDGGGSELSSGERGGGHTNGITNGRHSGYQELSDHERFPGLDRETARLQHHNMGPPNGGHLKKGSGPPPPDVVAAAASRYRHSYAEPHHMLSHPPPNHHHEMLHRTNSSVSSGRVGIAAVHPY
ncbi:hypothetical protein L9F63_009677 [Diploptera punctata]|uniref:PID domain-containing protein n=1 Tax=Diploptera punctata TaxID=6984 RepID=A0AAD8ERG5_DIPPU|nr:hypothetical protein L9F63_009677 [Diploptera punctata]